jgi:hypothetical protein
VPEKSLQTPIVKDFEACARAGTSGNAAPAAAVPKILRRETFIFIPPKVKNPRIRRMGKPRSSAP